MVQKANKFRAEDKSNRGKVGTESGLGNYCFARRITMDDEKNDYNTFHTSLASAWSSASTCTRPTARRSLGSRTFTHPSQAMSGSASRNM